MNDVMKALLDWLLTRTSVTNLVGTRIFVNRVPRGTIEAQDTFHPQKMLVIRQSGGSGKQDNMPTDNQAITALCYGESDLEADSVRRAVWKEFLDLNRVLQGDVRLYESNPTGGPVPLVDADIVWPAVAQNFSIKAAVF